MADPGTDLTPYGTADLADAAAKSGVSADLRETSWFRFPAAYDLGTKLNVQAGPVAVQDVITQIDITHAAGEPFTVVPHVGLTTDDPQNRLSKFVSRLASSVSTLERR